MPLHRGYDWNAATLDAPGRQYVLPRTARLLSFMITDRNDCLLQLSGLSLEAINPQAPDRSHLCRMQNANTPCKVSASRPAGWGSPLLISGCISSFRVATPSVYSQASRRLARPGADARLLQRRHTDWATCLTIHGKGKYD